ncbi:hypothetical protein JNUCC1_03365 [Lentibacillus sp. JNUCC-1]|nr:hypothetical protein [Lentibacillus sp. JNUCC-1]
MRVLYFAKAVAYVGLALFIYAKFIGPEGLADVLRIDNPSDEGLRIAGMLLPKYVIIWTIVTVVLEAISNFISFFEGKKK